MSTDRHIDFEAWTKETDRFAKLASFLDRLKKEEIYFELRRYRDEGVTVDIAVPGQRWEVDFLEDGTIEVERYVSNGVEEEGILKELFLKFGET